MAGIKEIRNRISSVTSTRKITSAMKMVSAAKLRKAQNAVLQMRPYSAKLQEILANVSSGLDAGSGNVFSKQREVKNVLLVVITSNGGLCGAFNSSVAKQAIVLARDSAAAGIKVDIVAIGKKGGEVLKGRGFAPKAMYNELFDAMSYDKVSEYANELMTEFEQGKYDQIVLLSNKFRNAASSDLTIAPFLPILPPSKQESSSAASIASRRNVQQYRLDYVYEPSQEYIVKVLIPKCLRVQLFSAMLESVAAEHGARMTAMHKATDNAGEMLKKLRLEFNKIRQSSITNEILEIVSGANALKG